jgi:hypothetical protein
MSEPPEADAGQQIGFGPKDLHLLDLALSKAPELYLAAWAVKRRRELRLSYPLSNHRDLLKLMGNKEFAGGGYRIRPRDVARYMPPEFFPINTDEDLLVKVHIALAAGPDDRSSPPYARSKRQRIMSLSPTVCPAGVFTNIYSSTSMTGYLLVSMNGFDQTVAYAVYESSPPFYFRNTLTFAGGSGSGGPTYLKIGPGAVQVYLWVMPTTAAAMLCISV